MGGLIRAIDLVNGPTVEASKEHTKNKDMLLVLIAVVWFAKPPEARLGVEDFFQVRLNLALETLRFIPAGCNKAGSFAVEPKATFVMQLV
jgi:hypothetical protein